MKTPCCVQPLAANAVGKQAEAMSRPVGGDAERRANPCEISIVLQAKTCLARGAGIAASWDYQTKTRQSGETGICAGWRNGSEV